MDIFSAGAVMLALAAAIWILSHRMVWASLLALGALTLLVTALACTAHFMVLQAVASLIGAAVMFVGALAIFDRA